MDPCPICGAAHAPAAAGEVCGAACLRAVVARVSALESPTVRGVPFDLATTSVAAPPNVSLGGSAGGSGGLK